MTTHQVLEALVAVGLIGGALSVVFGDHLMKSVIRFSMVSLMAVVAFALLAAPDVAITEAVIGSGLVTFVFVVAIRSSVAKEDTHEKDH